MLFGYGGVFVAVRELGAGGGGAFFYKHCGFFTLESCFHLCVETCGGGFLILAVVCLGDLSLSDFYRCLFVRSKYGLQLL